MPQESHNDEPVERYDGTATWMGHTATSEYLADLRARGLNAWLTLLSGRPIPARGVHSHGPFPCEQDCVLPITSNKREGGAS